MRKILLLLFLLHAYSYCFSISDSVLIRVHFLYGSKPQSEYKDQEGKWFGGMLGGHVGIEYEENKIIDFIPSGELHIIAHKTERHSRFTHHTSQSFWEIFGADGDSVKKTSITIPISREQKNQLDSIVTAYYSATPYDYAFVGMRCGAAAYDILSKIGILKTFSHRKTYMRIFYPRRLRKRLFRMAEDQHWYVERQEGTKRRKWESD